MSYINGNFFTNSDTHSRYQRYRDTGILVIPHPHDCKGYQTFRYHGFHGFTVSNDNNNSSIAFFLLKLLQIWFFFSKFAPLNN